MLTLLTRLGLDGVGFQRGLNQAKAAASQFGVSIQGSLKSKIAGAFSVAAVTAFARSIFQAAGEIWDTAERLQISTDRMQELEMAAKNSGVGFTAVEAAVTKLYDGIQGGTKETIEGLEALGFSASHIAKMDFDTALGLVINRLNGVEDATKRASIAMDLFGGKGGLKMLQTAGALGSVGEVKFNRDTLQNIDDIETAMSNVNKTIQASIANFFTSSGKWIFRPIDSLKEKFLPGGSMPSPFGAAAGAGAPNTGLQPEPAEDPMVAAQRWMAMQDEINKLESETATNNKQAANNAMTDDERRNALLKERLEIMERLRSLGFAVEVDELEKARLNHALSEVNKSLSMIHDANAGGKKQSALWSGGIAESSGYVGGLSGAVASASTASMANTLREIRDLLGVRGIKLTRF